MRMANIFKRGYEAAREEKKRQDERREQLGKRLFRFFLKDDGDEARVRFLTEEPVTFNEHNIKSVKGGKETYNSVLCDSKNCRYCADGDKPSFKGAFLIFDYTPFEVKDDKGKKKTVKGSVKLYVAGSKVLAQLDRISSKYGLTEREYEISRSGKGTSTSYIIERTDEVGSLSEKEIEKMLPDKLKEEYDGTDESLYSIVEEQLEMYLPSNTTKSREDDEEDDDDDEEYESRKNLVSYDDDDEEDEEEEEAPRRKKPVSKVVKKSSVKSLFKKR